jgi:uncharacterized membrane protein
MNRLARWLDVVQWLLVAGMFASGAVAWPNAPEQLPVHWNLAGQVDRYGGKLEGIFGLPVVALCVAVLFVVLPRIDPNRARYAQFRVALSALRLGIQVVLAGVYAVIVLAAFGGQVNVGLVVAGLVGALFVLLGAILGQVQPNWFFGIRTPWTLSSEESWSATHHAARWVFPVMGLAIALAGLVQTPWALYLAISTCLGGVLGLVVYSYLVWRTTVR